MSVSAQPTHVQLPLPGGQEGASVRLHPLLSGELLSPLGLLERPSGSMSTLRGLHSGGRANWVWLPVPAFLVEHPGAGPILIDTGLHPSIVFDPSQNWGRLGARVYRFRMTAEQAVPEQLRARGIDPGDVAHVVMTHLHTDHASGVSEFPRATFVLDRREWESATAPRGTLRGYRTAQFDYGFDWRTIDYDAPEVDSFATFAHSVDLFGDGSVRLLATPGHTPGHQSVLLRLGEGEALLTADAAYERRTIDHDVEQLFLADKHLYWRSLKEIRRFVESTPTAVVIPGHDRELWPTLEAVYD